MEDWQKALAGLRKPPRIFWQKARGQIPLLTFVFFAVIASLGFNALINQARKPKFTRSQCLVRMDISIAREANTQLSTKTAKLIREFVTGYRHRQRLPLAGINIVRKDPSIYFQYDADCGKKAIMTRALAEAFSVRHPDLMKFQLSKDVIEPGTDTLAISGPSWIDEK